MTSHTPGVADRKSVWSAIYSHASGFSIPLWELSMRRVNLFSFYKLGACLSPLRLVGWFERDLASRILVSAQQQLTKLGEEALASIKVLSRSAAGIRVDIDESFGDLYKLGRVSPDDEERLAKSIGEFEAILEAQTPTEYIYAIEQVRGFSMPILVDSADQNLSAQTLARLPSDVKRDIQEAGRCLAFELPTAAGIHTMRAFEKTLRRFYEERCLVDAGHKDIYKLIEELKAFRRGPPE
jgi:hypothetical protein